MNAIVPVVEIKKEKLVVSSRKIANQLKKEHSKIIRTLDKLVLEKPDLAFLIIPTFYRVNNQKRQYKEYLLTKDGFTLYMFNIQGYNDFKMAYINEFNRMEKLLKEPKQLTLQEKMRYKGKIVLTVKNLGFMYGLNEDKILNVIYKLNIHPVLLKGVELSELKREYNLHAISNLYVLGFDDCIRIIDYLGLKRDSLKEYFEIVETVSDKENNVKMLGKCIELYDELIDMNINKIYEMKKELFNNKTYPQHIKKIIFNVFQTVELKKLNI
ncbi:Rha family transcriptional regulator [uncultured Parvimonas sp.]|uniref:Rha family transcriptional regulator n=1 Tax=uncultured Parvimonas sp. TaxID=747372 RepID=UPI0025930B6A|nr:Rha family transcriptional regulator [uncultured Parvimonas sp.]